jgi:hypothetical protein
VDDSITRILRAKERAQMNAPPEANTEYSRGSGPFRGLFPGNRRASLDAAGERPHASGPALNAVLLTALLGTLLLVVSQFTVLYRVHSTTSSAAIKTVGTGANHAWAPLVLALVALVLVVAVHRHGNRTALLALAALGIATLLIALLRDLPPTHATGLVGSATTGYERAVSTRGAGLYMETLGAVLLLVAGGIGFLMLAGPSARDRHLAPSSEPTTPSSEQTSVSKDSLTLVDEQRRRWSAS